MNTNLFKRTLLAAALASSMALVGCSETPQETREDVAEAQRKANENVAEARIEAQREVNEAQRDLVDAANPDMTPLAGTLPAPSSSEIREDINEERAELTREQADANYQIAKANAEGEYKVAKERCDPLTGQQEDACNATAKATYEQRMADADLQMKRYEELADATEDGLQ